jgi:hypothetical protein
MDGPHGTPPCPPLLTTPCCLLWQALGGWTDPSGKELVGGRMLSLLQRALGRCGALTWLDLT